MNSNRRLNVVSDEQSDLADLAELRAEFHAFREEVRIWQAVTCGVVAGLSLLIGALITVFKT